MNHSQITEQIYNRHLQALRRVSGDGTWMDESAVRMALWLSLTELAERLGAEPAPVHASWTNVVVNPPFGAGVEPHVTVTPADLVRLGEWLDENLEEQDLTDQSRPAAERAKDAIRDLQDRLNAETGANITLRQYIANLERDQVAAVSEAGMLRQQRTDHGERIQALESEISSQRAALADLQQSERMATNRVVELQALLAAHQAAPVALASPNGHGPAAPAADFLAPKADVPEGLSPAAEDAWRSCQQGASFRRLPAAIRLELVQAVLRQAEIGQPMKMSEYDTFKPSWMPSANGMPTVFGCTWLDLPDLTPDRIKAPA